MHRVSSTKALKNQLKRKHWWLAAVGASCYLFHNREMMDQQEGQCKKEREKKSKEKEYNNFVSLPSGLEMTEGVFNEG